MSAVGRDPGTDLASTSVLAWILHAGRGTSCAYRFSDVAKQPLALILQEAVGTDRAASSEKRPV